MKTTIFKAYDVRGKYPEEINGEVVKEIVGVLVDHFQSIETNENSKVIIIGHDTRLSSPELYKAAVAALDYRIIEVGMTTTPMLYFLVNYYKAVGGIMITASHNPREYNGLKVVGPQAVPVSGKEILKLIKKP